jgi:hypothetical protein
MAEQCFVKSGSAPPVCGVHNERLLERNTRSEPVIDGVGDFSFFVCPVSGQVVNGTATHK